MKHRSQNSIGKKKKGLILFILILIVLLFLNLPYNSNIDINEGKQFNDDSHNIKNPNISLFLPNSRSLQIYQYTTISNSFFPLSLPTNISFTLVEGWTAKNVTINYDGVTHQKDWVINGTFETNENPWKYNSSDDTKILNNGWQSEYVGIEVDNFNAFPKGSFGYFSENFTIPETQSSNTIATLFMNYMYHIDSPATPSSNISAFISIEIGGIEKNLSKSFINLVEDDWTPMSLSYDLIANGQQLPNNITLRAGVYVDNFTNTENKDQFLYLDDIQFTVHTNPNLPSLLIANDAEFNLNYTYQNSSFGSGFAFIDMERSKSETSDIIFTISKNSTYTEEFEIYNITIISEAVKIFNSTYNGQEGSLNINGENIYWQTEATIFIPSGYLNNWAEIMKPYDWNATSILDGFDVEKKGSCTGINLGSGIIIIPIGVLSSGLWTLEFISWNYIVKGGTVVWNGTSYNEQSSFTLGDTFQINATLNNTISFANTQVNCTIEYPNGTIFWQKSKTLGSYNINFGDLTVGTNMSVGSYQTIIEWTNNQSQSDRDKVGFSQFGFSVWHQTNLTAVNPDEIRVSGEPYLMKVEFRDYNLNQTIDFATITFNSTYGASGTMAYLGSSIYVFDVDLSGWSPGDYYFSFNASKNYYENQSLINLIHLEIIYQPLALEVPHSVINADANSYAICRVNVTGALTGTPLNGSVNVTTDWHKDFTVTDYLNGTVRLNLSTYNVPTQGIPETFTITIFANKTNYGSTSGFISITVHPIPTIVNVNETIVDVYINRSFYLSVNYTEDGSSEIISGATLSVSWDSFYSIIPVVNGFIVSFSTIDLSLGTYTIILQINHSGYETGFQSVYVHVLPKTTSLKIFLNQEDKTSDKSLSIPGNEPLNITILYKDNIADSFISGATLELIELDSGISETLTENGQQYSIIFNPGDLPVKTYFFSITAQKENYSIVPSSITITIEQIEIHIETIGINGTRELFAGDSFSLSIILTEEGSDKLIENANVSYSWLSYLDKAFTNMGDGIYEIQIKIPDSAKGSYNIDLIIRIEGNQFKDRNFPLPIYVLQKLTPNYLIWIILGISIPVIGVLSALSLRSYVLVPRKRKKERLFMKTIQVFKDVKNIQAVMIIQKNSGLPFFNKNYANFESDNSLISGFIQAITIFGEQMINDEKSDDQRKKSKEIYSKNIIELNFKYFHLLICDYQSIRSLLILREHSSTRLMKQFYLLSVKIDAKLGNKIENFTGEVTDFESKINAFLDEFLFLHYKAPLKLIDDASYMKFLKKGGELQVIESRILNVILSITKLNKEFTINKIIKEIDEKEIDKIYGGLHTLIHRNIIIPATQDGDDAHPLLGGLKK